jgi:NADPH:quinone reductase-like Zn-dependent oxidoreductase
MPTMHAAVVRSFDAPPHYETFSTPQATDPDELVVDVLAAALHPRVRSGADGSHYESTGELPLIPGVDGVGRTPEGELVYFVLDDTLLGSMAERVVVDRRRCAVLPQDADPATIAAAMNPAMSSWVALRNRIAFEAGQRVLVLGATGNAGRMAVQIAKHLGASHVIAAGRDQGRLAGLAALGADETVSLAGDPRASAAALGAAAAAAEVDVVIDYLWGSVAQAAMPAIIKGRPDRGRPLTWIEVGSMAGLELTLESQWLRAARLQLVGSGQGSVSTRAIVGELSALAAHLGTSDYAIDARPTPLSEVERTWISSAGSTDRVVFVP